MLQGNAILRNVTGISGHEQEAIRHFIQGAVYCWCKNRPGDWFAVRDLAGGENFYWDRTPLQVLFEKHRAQARNNAVAIEQAAKDLGWLVKRVLQDDKRSFEARKEGGRKGPVASYHWVGGER